MKTALIAGATGLVGGNLLKSLLESSEYKNVISIGRRELPLKNQKLEHHVVNFENLEEIKFKVDAVFCCLGTTIKKAGSKDAFKKVDFEYPQKLAKHASENGATSFHLISSMGANSDSSFFYNKVKGDVENEISNLSFEQIHIYRPSMLIGKRAENRVIERVSLSILKVLSFLFIGPLKNYKAIDASKVADCMFQSSLSNEIGLVIHYSGQMQN